MHVNPKYDTFILFKLNEGSENNHKGNYNVL